MNAAKVAAPVGGHTPGPWAVGFSDGTGQTYITAGDHPALKRPEEAVVVVVAGCEDSWGVPQGVRNPADARLIAAAPELLEALEYAIQQVPELATVPGIAAALARATGAAS